MQEIGTTLEALIAPYPKSFIKQKPGGFAASYVPIEQAKQRLLALHGPFSWVITHSLYVCAGPRDEKGPHHRYEVTGELHLIIDDHTVILSGQGSDSFWDYSKKNSDWYFRDNAEASAEAQAFKRALSNSGQGLELYCDPKKGPGFWLPNAARFKEVAKEIADSIPGSDGAMGELEDAIA